MGKYDIEGEKLVYWFMSYACTSDRDEVNTYIFGKLKEAIGETTFIYILAVQIQK